MVDIAPEFIKDTPSTTLGKVDYENWSKEELIEKIRKLECHVFQLRNVIAKRPDSKVCFLELEGKRKRANSDEDGTTQDGVTLPNSIGRKAKKPRPFDFSL